MSESTDLIAPEDNNLAELQQKEQVRPKFTFKGKELAPYSRGSRILYGMVCDNNDLVIYRVLAFLYIHLQPRDEMIPLVWGDINKFRAKIIDFRETLTDEDEVEAQRIVDELLEADRSTRVIAEPEDDPTSNSKKKDYVNE